MIHIIMRQYSLKTRLRKFKKRGKESVTKELTRLHAPENVLPVDATKITKKQRAEAVAPLIFLKEKCNGNIKRRACVDDRKQRETIKSRTRLHLQFPQSQCL